MMTTVLERQSFNQEMVHDGAICDLCPDGYGYIVADSGATYVFRADQVSNRADALPDGTPVSFLLNRQGQIDRVMVRAAAQ